MRAFVGCNFKNILRNSNFCTRMRKMTVLQFTSLLWDTGAEELASREVGGTCVKHDPFFTLNPRADIA